jgi:type I restriction enzyme R subunit
MVLPGGEYPKLAPIQEAGGGAVQEKERAWMSQIIERVNELFQGDLTDQDMLVYVNDVLKGKLLESQMLRAQAANNTKGQFANSPDLDSELTNAIIGALDAHNAMSAQALASETVRNGLKGILLNYARLYESLREVRPTV